MKNITTLLAIALLGAQTLFAAEGRWATAWLTTQQPTEPAKMNPALSLEDCTLRQIIQPTLAGAKLRVVFSNQYGEKPYTIAGARVAKSLGASDIDPACDRVLKFAGQDAVTLLPGMVVYSDEVALEVVPFENLAVSVRLQGLPARLTGHPGSRTTSFYQAGDKLAAASLPDAAKVDQWFTLASLEVYADKNAASIVVIGDSITDGRGSTTNKNDRWPNQLARRLHATAKGRNIAVLNQGVGAGRALRDGVGDSALRRFDRDVLAVPGVKWVVVFEGVNDIGTSYGKEGRTARSGIVNELILGYRQMIRKAHSHGLRIIGATIMPFDGFTSYYHEYSEADRQEINQWIRNSGEFDGVIDFDLITRDPKAPTKLLPAVDGGDHLHPSAAGYQLMAEGIDLKLFKR